MSTFNYTAYLNIYIHTYIHIDHIKVFVHSSRFCLGRNADSICDWTAVKPRLPQPKAALSARLISAAVILGRGGDYNRSLFTLFQKAAFVLQRDIERLANV